MVANLRNSYILDTSCFYWLGFQDEKVRLLEKIQDKLYTSLSVPLEIISGMREYPDDFKRRRKPLQNWDRLIGCNIGHAIDTNITVSESFGILENPSGLILALGLAIHAIHKANTIDELLAEIPDYDLNAKFRINWEMLEVGRQKTGQWFMEQFNSKTKEYKETVKQLLKMELEDKKEIRMALRDVIDRSYESPDTTANVIVGLACRGKLISEKQVMEGLDDKDKENALKEKAMKHYNGSLQTYIDAYIHFHKISIECGRTATRNDFLDLESFLLISDTESQFYVSNDDLWFNIANRIKNGMGMRIDDLVINF